MGTFEMDGAARAQQARWHQCRVDGPALFALVEILVWGFGWQLFPVALIGLGVGWFWSRGQPTELAVGVGFALAYLPFHYPSHYLPLVLQAILLITTAHGMEYARRHT